MSGSNSDLDLEFAASSSIRCNEWCQSMKDIGTLVLGSAYFMEQPSSILCLDHFWTGTGPVLAWVWIYSGLGLDQFLPVAETFLAWVCVGFGSFLNWFWTNSRLGLDKFRTWSEPILASVWIISGLGIDRF